MLTLDRITTVLNADADEQDRMDSLLALSQEPLSIELVEATIQVLRNSLEQRIGSRARREIERVGRNSVDLAGTGGSGIQGRFNTSTASSFVVAASGARVVKFGNGRITGTSGSADFLQQAGIQSLMRLDSVPDVLDATGLVFLYAPAVYPELASLQSVRRRLGRPTVFNFIGPLLNPSRPQFRLLGVSKQPVQHVLANVLLRDTHTERAFVVRADDGLDEISCECTSTILEVNQGEVGASRFTRHVTRESQEGEAPVSGAEANVQIFERIIGGSDNQSRQFHMLALNSGAALVAARKAATIANGVDLASELIASGSVQRLYEKCKVVYGKLS